MGEWVEGTESSKRVTSRARTARGIEQNGEWGEIQREGGICVARGATLCEKRERVAESVVRRISWSV